MVCLNHSPKIADEIVFCVYSFVRYSAAGSYFIVTEDSAAPVKSEGTGFTFCLETDDVATAVTKAVTAVAARAEGQLDESEENGCCGGVVGKLTDPYGFVWTICSPPKKMIAANVEA